MYNITIEACGKKVGIVELVNKEFREISSKQISIKNMKTKSIGATFYNDLFLYKKKGKHDQLIQQNEGCRIK